jgi:ABC-type transporter Mla MlaB component
MNGLRFLRHNDSDAVRFELAGSLGGVDAETLHQVWQGEVFIDALRPVIVDITSITEVDQHGRALLIMMHRFGARIISQSPVSSAIAQTCVHEPVDASVSKARRLVGFPRRAEMIGLTSAGYRFGHVAHAGLGDL